MDEVKEVPSMDDWKDSAMIKVWLDQEGQCQGQNDDMGAPSELGTSKVRMWDDAKRSRT